MELVLATRNVHKLREIRDMLKPLKSLDILSLMNFPDYEPPPEDGKSFEENAFIKAEHASKSLGKWVMADDSGLVVPSLGGEPGIYSKRYAGEGATDRENNQKLLGRLSGKNELDRSAYYATAVCLIGPNGEKKQVIGYCEGRIIEKERGRGGFGYDPLFVKNEYEKTFAELDEATKNRVSHRRKAIDKLIPYLETINTVHTNRI